MWNFLRPAQAEPERQPDTELDSADLEERLVAALRTVYDPEIPVNIYDLGLIYGMKISGERVAVSMTLTAPACPVAGSIVAQVEDALRGVTGVKEVNAELVWDPPWSAERMSDEAKLELGML